MAKSNFVYCDANVFLYFLRADPQHGPLVRQFFEEVRGDTRRKLVTSVITMTEVSFTHDEKQAKRLDPTVVDLLDGLWGDTQLLELIQCDQLIAARTRQLLRELMVISNKLKVIDAIHLTSALSVGAEEFLTYDRKGL